MMISLNKRITALELYLKSECSFHVFKARWEISFPGEPCLNRKYMARLLLKFRTFGDLKNVKRRYQRPVRQLDVITDISAFYQLHPGTSLRKFKKEESCDMSLSTLRTILKNDLGLKPYKCRRFHKLNGQNDFDQRYHMCKSF